MSLNKKDEEQLRAWFLKLSDCMKKGTDLKSTLIEYYAYREKIANLVLTKLDDLFQIKKQEWKIRNKINEDDSVSIIHDSLLTALDKFKLTFNVKFITFFWRVLHSKLYDFIAKYKKIKPYSSKLIPDPLVHSLDYLQLNNIGILMSRLDDSQIDYTFLLESIGKRLSRQQQFILKSLLQGDTVEQVAQSLNVTGQTIRTRLKRMRQTLHDIEEQLCQTKRP